MQWERKIKLLENYPHEDAEWQEQKWKKGKLIRNTRNQEPPPQKPKKKQLIFFMTHLKTNFLLDSHNYFTQQELEMLAMVMQS